MTSYLQTFAWGVAFVEDGLGTPMESMEGSLFAQRGIEAGDVMYLAYIDDRRRLNLISRLEVQKMRPGVGTGPDVLDAVRQTSTPMTLGRLVPKATARRLRFLVRVGFDKHGDPIYARKKTELTFEDDGRLRFQTARTIRRLDESSAKLLDVVLASH